MEVFNARNPKIPNVQTYRDLIEEVIRITSTYDSSGRSIELYTLPYQKQDMLHLKGDEKNKRAYKTVKYMWGQWLKQLMVALFYSIIAP